METKICSNKNCQYLGKPQLTNNFVRDKYRPDGLHIYCKDCVKLHQIKPRSKYLNFQSSSKNRNIEFDLSFDLFEKLIELNCFYCENVLASKSAKGYNLDRISNDKSIGYVINNIVPCCIICNYFKLDHFTLLETLIGIEAYVQHEFPHLNFSNAIKIEKIRAGIHPLEILGLNFS